MKKTISAFFIFLLLSSVAYAADESPVTLLRETTKETLALLRKQQNLLESKTITRVQHHENVNQGLKTILEPHVAKDLMASQMLGRSVWAKASQQQKDRFVNLFEHLLSYTYSSALTSHVDSKITILPIKGGYKGKRFVPVTTKVTTGGGPDVFVKYHMVKIKGEWKVYDLSIRDTGISMVQSYKSQFAPYTRKKGIKGASDLLQKTVANITKQAERKDKAAKSR